LTFKLFLNFFVKHTEYSHENKSLGLNLKEKYPYLEISDNLRNSSLNQKIYVILKIEKM
jgi:hypothetical protein